MKLIHTKLPDSQCLEHCALAAVIAPNQQVELGEVVGLLAHALEIAQGQSSNHSGAPFMPNVEPLVQLILLTLSSLITIT